MTEANLTKNETKALQKLNAARLLWSDHVRGVPNDVLADRHGIPINDVPRAIKAAAVIVGTVRNVELDIEHVRIVEEARLNAIHESLWDMALGQPFEHLFRRFIEEDDYEPEAVDRLREVVQATFDKQRDAVTQILKIMDRRAKLLAVDRQAPPAGAIVMPTFIFTAPEPGKRDPADYGIVIDASATVKQ